MRRSHHADRTIWTTVLSMILSGLSLGWLMGMSASPVIGIVLTSLLTVIAGLTSALSGIQSSAPETPKQDEPAAPPAAPAPKRFVNPIPLATLLISIAVGGAAGIGVRTHNMLSPSPDEVVRQWLPRASAASADLTEGQIRRRLFDISYPPLSSSAASEAKASALPEPSPSASSHTSATTTTTTTSIQNSIFFATTSSVCTTLRADDDPTDESKLRRDIATLVPGLQQYVQDCKSGDDIHYLVQDVICKQ